MTNHTRPTQIVVYDPPPERSRAELETLGVNALCKDEEFAVGTKGWARKQQALMIVRVVLDAVLT